jgi:hypothetical protein
MWADLLVVNGAPLADVTMLRWRESLALVIKDGRADAGTLRPRAGTAPDMDGT